MRSNLFRIQCNLVEIAKDSTDENDRKLANESLEDLKAFKTHYESIENLCQQLIDKLSIIKI